MRTNPKRSTFFKHNSTTTMTGIDEALAECDTYGSSEKIPWSEIATKHGVVRSTLTRRYKGETQPHASKIINQQHLNPQQEVELVNYIEGRTDECLPPTRTMVRNFASSLAKTEVSERWVDRFIHRHKDQLKSQWTTGVAAKRHTADSGENYKLYFDMLRLKMDEYPDVILKRLTKNNSEASESQENSTSCLSGEDWRKLDRLLRAAVKDERKEAKVPRQSFHHMAVENQLVRHQIESLVEALSTKKKPNKRGRAKDLQQHKEYHGGAQFWSPRAMREAKARDNQIEHEEKLKKADEKRPKAAAKLCNEKTKEARCAVREEAKVKRANEKAEKAASRAQQKKNRDAAKSINSPLKGKRKALSSDTEKNKRQKRVSVGIIGAEAAKAPSPSSLKTTRHGRSVKLPSRYK